jgi:hypothetical protein
VPDSELSGDLRAPTKIRRLVGDATDDESPANLASTSSRMRAVAGSVSPSDILRLGPEFVRSRFDVPVAGSEGSQQPVTVVDSSAMTNVKGAIGMSVGIRAHMAQTNTPFDMDE